ncbi:MAG: cell division protein FtsA [Terriglobia bacterium]
MSAKRIYSAGLDTGSTQTRCVIGVLEDERMHFLGYGCVPSEGWAKSRIADQQAVSDCIHRAVVQAEDTAGVSIESVVAGIGGLTVRGANSRGRWDMGRPREITQKDVNRAMDRAMRVQLQEDRMILEVLPQDFVVDDHPGFHDPRQMLGSTLEANAHLVTASQQEHNNLVGAINRVHLSVDETVFEAIASCYASVLPDDRRDGVALVDIGQHSSEMVCYFGESAQLATTLKICGDHFSRDLAHALRIPLESAALVKEAFGSAQAEGTAENSVVELPMPDSVAGHGPLRDAPRKLINEILESRAVELFEMVRGELARFGMQRALANGLVISGGGALLAGICDVAERVLECPARMGLAQGFKDWPEELNDPAWTVAAGLAMYSARLHTQVDVEKQSIGMLGRILR